MNRAPVTAASGASLAQTYLRSEPGEPTSPSSQNGNRIGYAVPRADGSGVNYFDNSGRRTGYQNYEKR